MRRVLLLSVVLTSCTQAPTSQTPGDTSSPPVAQEPAEPVPPTVTEPSGRQPAISADNPHYARVEGTSLPNDCSSDAQCFTGGCSSEMCTAEQGAGSTCELPAEGWPSAGASCGCVSGSCQWYRMPGGSASSDTQPPPVAALPAQGEPCTEAKACADGLTCLSYYGIAGASGPEFHSCEIPCPSGGSCPEGQACTTIADGPGAVCRSR